MDNKRRMINEVGQKITKELVDQGKLIEAGFAIFRHYAISQNAPQIQVDEMRLAFMAGAEHVWSSMMSMLDPGSEETPADMRRMDMIQRELDEWRGKLSQRVDPAKGSA